MKCRKCSSEENIKFGKIDGVQRYQCKCCGYLYTVERRSTEKPPEVKQMALDLYLEGLGFRAIGRILKISHGTVYQWVRKTGESLELPKTEGPVAVVELDEMHSYVGQKKITAGYGSPSTGTEKAFWILSAVNAIR